MKLLLIASLALFVGLAFADVKEGKYVKKEEKQYYKKERSEKVQYNKPYSYHGKYEGKCDKDGFYYKDDNSFMICSNNNAYDQPCAPGSRNSAFENYNYGDSYYYRDFCDVNLVDHGYGVKHYGGYADKKVVAAPYYEAPSKVSYQGQHMYHGKYGGQCAQDGFYYKDDSSFVICSNDNAYVQACAPGSRNSGLNNYQYGQPYYYRDFCDINLVDHGYGVNKGYDNRKGGYGGDRQAYGYEEPHYGFGQYERNVDRYGAYSGYGDKDAYKGGFYGGYVRPNFYGRARRDHPY